MKIGILTQPLRNNYGGLLQNYALQQILIRNGYEVETLDYASNKRSQLKATLSYSVHNFLHIILPSHFPKVEYAPSTGEINIIHKNTNYFIQKYIIRTKLLISKKSFKQYGEQSNVAIYVVGSDQCWRPRYNRKYLFEMFLNFVEDRNDLIRIAYGVSFGTDNWEFTAEQTCECRRLLQKFDLVTVRENSGNTLCKEHFGIDAYQVLDPTLLLNKSDYIHIINQENEKLSEGTLFCYFLDPTEQITNFVSHCAEVMNFTPFMVMPKYKEEYRTKNQIKNHIEDCIYPSVTKWLRAFYDAKMTIVDSFHGMVFSIIFNKPFWVIGNKNRGLSRFISMLSLLGLENRLVDVKDVYSIDISTPIDWDSVNAILNTKRIESINLLLNGLKTNANNINNCSGI